MTPRTSTELADAVAYLDRHVNFEKAPARRTAPTLDRMRALCELLGDPHRAYPVVHLTGTNGKGSTARMLTALLTAHGLTTGTYTSPHLETLNERMAWNGEPIPDEALAEHLLSIEPLERHLGVELTHFEVLTAAAFTWFADLAVDVGVIEVGLGGRWDATNVSDGQVAVVTNIGLDHAEVIGPTLREIAEEKSGIVKPGATLILGERRPDLAAPFQARGASEVWRRDVEFGCVRNVVAHGGRVFDLQTPGASYDDVFVPLHGPHQGDNAACAVAAAEAFFGRTLDQGVVADAMGAVQIPGRFEIAGRAPLTVLDGAHNPDGAAALARTLGEDFSGRTPTVVVVGFTLGRDPAEMLTTMGVPVSARAICCRPPHPRGLPAAEVADAARAVGFDAEVADSVRGAVDRARDLAGRDGFVLVTGSLYLVGEARAALH
jgi:dihydrofolate synthase / folylpolyglutamate synthase